jgi:regulation of enolase protein 1 (concanavalin A-like superfamily)
VDPDGDCTIAPAGTRLTITVPGKGHDLTIEFGRINAPRVLQEVEGDFTVQVKVVGTLGPTAATSIPGRPSFQAAGLLLWSDEHNYVRMEHATVGQANAVLSYAALELRAGGQIVAPPTMDMRLNDVWLRLERRGNQITGSWSLDGRFWLHLGQVNAALPARVRLGVLAINTAKQQLEVRFEDFKLDRGQ